MQTSFFEIGGAIRTSGLWPSVHIALPISQNFSIHLPMRPRQNRRIPIEFYLKHHEIPQPSSWHYLFLLVQNYLVICKLVIGKLCWSDFKPSMIPFIFIGIRISEKPSKLSLLIFVSNCNSKPFTTSLRLDMKKICTGY